jgi:hypothetical protein
MEEEIVSMTAVTLIMSILEHLDQHSEISEQIRNINVYFLEELSRAQTKEYRNMLIQGIMMSFKYFQLKTIESLQSIGYLSLPISRELTRISKSKDSLLDSQLSFFLPTSPS